MNVKSSYIPKSAKASGVAKVLGLKVKQVRGRYVANVAPDLTPTQARRIAYILHPAWAVGEEQEAIMMAQHAVDHPGQLGITQEEASQMLDRALEGWWALGVTY